MSRLVIIDGSNLARRAFHAGGQFGVVSCARKIRAMLEGEELEIVACWDGPPPTWRHRLWQPYKAHRERQPEALRAVRADFAEALREGIPGYLAVDAEADDAAATLALQAVTEGRRVLVVSSDKDWGQILGLPGVEWRAPESGGALALRDEDWFIGRYGVGPVEWPDYVGLAGDASDGIPGVRGVGPVKARRLLEDFGSLDGWLEHGEVDDLARGQALVSRQLARLKVDAKLERHDKGVPVGA